MADILTVKEELKKSLITGHIDDEYVSVEDYRPKLLTNDSKKNSKVLTSILQNLETCDEFFFSVAFITTSGVAVIINMLNEHKHKGVKGHILTSQYQNFTEPKALERLLQFENIDLRIMTENNFHAKGYLFRKGNEYNLIIGSSNLTQNALCVNGEWNLEISALADGEIAKRIRGEFDNQFGIATVVDEYWVKEYKKIYDESKPVRVITKNGTEINYTGLLAVNRPSPNTMQLQALNALEAIRAEGKKKALIISATGTGKTYLSAFDVKKFKPGKFLFVIHRENVARAAMKSYKRIFGNDVTMGFYTGNKQEKDADFLFSTIQTISKQEHLNEFRPDEFDYIVIDEAHRSGAESYQRLIDFFKPKFLLGMTATPERTDGFDIFKTFDYNIAYEIRLHRALEEKMLSPFHYYGVTDITVDGRPLEEEEDFNDLTSDERVKHIIEYANFYGCDRGRVKGLIFCSRIDEAKELSIKMNRKGFRTVALSGDSSEDERESAIRLLESDNSNESIDYILTRDIFNEGVDIPSVNQVIMLRPTQSAIIFVQQLGRGLRKIEGKEYLTVIDFIGNYSNNYLVPIALYGDRTYNKDTIRKLVSTGSSMIPGASTVDFDFISKERIYKAIDDANVNSMKDLKQDYKLLKFKIGKIPSMMDFVKSGDRDPYSFVMNKSCGSYYGFLCKVESETLLPLAKDYMQRLNFFSVEICNGKRLAELEILYALLTEPSVFVEDIIEKLIPYNSYSKKTLESAIAVLNGEFNSTQVMANYCKEPVCYVKDGFIVPSIEFQNRKENRIFIEQLVDTVKYGLYKFKKAYNAEKFRDGFMLEEKYSRKDVCRILNWPNDEASTMYGYRIKYNTCPIFVTYEKSEDISKSTLYDDYIFPNKRQFHWMTRNSVKLDSSEPLAIKAWRETGLRICLFIKKSDGESDDFYYMSDLTPYEFNPMTIQNDKGKELPIVNINYDMKDPVSDSLYNYLASDTKKYSDENNIIDFEKTKKEYPKASPEVNLKAAQNISKYEATIKRE